MRNFYLFCFFHILIHTQAVCVPKALPPGCDTLITMDGTIYLIQIKWQNDQEIRYTRCDQGKGEYAMQRNKIRELKPYERPVLAKKVALPPAPAPVPEPATWKPVAPPPKPEAVLAVRDTFDLLTLTNREQYRVLILERDYYNTYYRLYDDPLDDREYCVSNQQVRSMHIAKTHRKYKQTNMQTILVVGLSALVLLLLTF